MLSNVLIFSFCSWPSGNSSGYHILPRLFLERIGRTRERERQVEHIRATGCHKYLQLTQFSLRPGKAMFPDVSIAVNDTRY